MSDFEIKVESNSPVVRGVPGKEPLLKRILHTVGIGRLPIKIVPEEPPPLDKLEMRFFNEHVGDDQYAIRVLRAYSSRSLEQGNMQGVVAALRKVLENPSDTDLLRALNRAGAEKFIANFQSGFKRDGSIFRHKSECFFKKSDRAGYEANPEAIFDKYGLFYSLRYGHATPMIMCASQDSGNKASVIFYDPISGVREEETIKMQVNDERFSAIRGDNNLRIDVKMEGSGARDLTVDQRVTLSNLNKLFGANRIACPGELVAGLARTGSFGTNYIFENDQTLVGNFLRALRESKLQRYQHDAQNCVPYSFYAYCLYEALRPGENEFKQWGRDQFSRDFGVFIPTREEIFATLDIRDPVKVLPITVR